MAGILMPQAQVCKPGEVVQIHMPAKLQPMGYRRTRQEEYAKPKARRSNFSKLQMLAAIQNKVSDADECPWC
jgi:hypothetical protein